MAFYHASDADLPVGAILTPRGHHLLDDDIESTLEQARPTNRPARNASVFMVADRRALENLVTFDSNVYRVRPRTPIIRLDHTWVNELWRLFAEHEDDDVDITVSSARLATRYWSGARALAPRWEPNAQPIWEYLAPSAVVMRKLR